jgi:hypothetical protein
MAWNRNTAWIASRTGSLPRKANDTLLIPPLTEACGSSALIRRVASMKSSPYAACSASPVPMANTLGSRMMSSGGNPARSVSSV